MSAAHSRALLGAWMLLPVLAACQIDDADVPKFGGPCSSGCANGFRCDKDLDACVPEEEPTDGGFPDAGFPDAGNPALLTFTVETATQAAGSAVTVERSEPFTLRWTTQDVADCNIGGVDVTPNGSRISELDVAGATSFVLTCTGNGAEVASDPVTVTVNAVIDGDLIVTDNASLDAAIGITEITGNVVIEGASITGVDQFATLTTVGGDFRYIGSTGLVDLELPLLASIDGSLVIGDDNVPQLESVSLPALVVVGESVRLEDLPDLESFSAPLLQDIGRDLYLGSYSYPQFPLGYNEFCELLADARPLPALDTLDLGSLVSIGRDFDVENATALRSLSLPALSSIGGMMAVFALGEFATGKATLSLPALTTASTIIISGNTNLGTIDLNSLENTVRIPAADAQDWDAPLSENLPSPLFHTYRATFDFYCVYYGYYPTTGDLFIYGNGLDGNDAIEDLRLGSLQYIAGGMVWNGSSDDALDLPELTSAEYINLEYGGPTATISFPALTELRDGGLSLYELQATSIRFSALTDVPGTIVLNPGSQVTEFSLAATVVDRLDIDAAGPAVLEGLNIVTVTGAIEISSAFLGTTLTGLEELTTVGGDFVLYTDTVTDISALSSLTTVGEDLELPSALLSSAGLESLESAGSVSVEDSLELTSLSLPSLTQLTGTYDGINAAFYSTAVLTEVLAPNLQTAGGTFYFSGAPITTVDIGSVSAIDGISVGNTALIDLDFLCGVTTNTGHVSLYGNTQLVSVDGLQNMSTLDYRLYARNLPAALECKISKLIENTGVTDIDLDFDYTQVPACDFDPVACP